MKYTVFSKRIKPMALLAASLLAVASCSDATPASQEEVAADTVAVKEVVMRYGLPIEEFDVVYDTLRRRQTLSDLLLPHGITPKQIHLMSQCPDTVFNARKVRPGQSVAVLCDKDSLSTPHYFVFEENVKYYVVFDLQDNCTAVRYSNPSEWRKGEAAGKIASSLWVAMQDAGVSAGIVVEMTKIFEWSVDFFGIRKGDEFRILYEREYVNGAPLNNYRIHAASFRASGNIVYAIPFEQDNERLYYNIDGNSLEGAFLKAPLDFYRISSKFTNNRLHPVLKINRPHHGVDYAAPAGTPVYAIGNGKVIKKSYQANGGGYYVKIRHHNTAYVTTYMHLSKFAKGLKEGDLVKQKQVIGYVGSTGVSTGPHLDFRVHENGKPIDPLTIKSQPKKPVSKENRPAFDIVADSLVTRLMAIPEYKPQTVAADSVVVDTVLLNE